ncbi:conidial yellow pigment biosynthesis polyketide synthase, partial [Rhypophila decipiens]
HQDQTSSERAPVSAAFFCPQARAPDQEYLAGLHAFLSQNQHGQSLLQQVAILATEKTWEIFAAARPDVRAISCGPACLQMLRDWAVEATSFQPSTMRSGIIALPMLAILQAGQYLRYLDFHQLSHQDFLREVGSGAGGLQGYCGGLPAAIAIACAKSEGEVVENIAIALRVLIGIGAYSEAADTGTASGGQDGSTTLALRLKYEGQGEELTSAFPGTYVSAITEPKSVSIVGSANRLEELLCCLKEQGFQVQKMDVRGKVHNPENAELAAELSKLCHATPGLQLPDSSRLQVPVRSNKTGETLFGATSLTDEIITTILASRCEWFKLITQVAHDFSRTKTNSHSLVVFGLTDCVPLTPFHAQKQRISKVQAHTLIQPIAPRCPSPWKLPGLSDQAIAVVGASCRLPGANNLDELWRLLAAGTDCHREVPTDRFDLHTSFRASAQNSFPAGRKFYGNFLDDIKAFDNAFFGVNPREAANMDPQQRLLLELSFEALDEAGYLSKYRREQGDDVGCFIGASFIEYLDNTNTHSPTAYTSTGTIRAFLCGRISYYYGWSGPAEVIDTACSSSLVAINRACKAIQGGECRMALAGGVNLITGMNNYLDLAKAGFLSPTGQCKPFDVSADGYCRSDGAGLVVLKRLRDAIAQGDSILGVIAGSATNQGGRSTAITVPEPNAQRALYEKVLSEARLAPDQVTHVEAHGTGTQAGDPLEIESIRSVFAQTGSSGISRQNTLHIGSIKGNIGHCETAAGVAGLLKVLSMLKHGQIPGQANHSSLNPKIPPLEPDKLAIASRLQDWDVPFRASLVSSYGAAGSNCALICCEAPRKKNDSGSHKRTKINTTSVVSIPLLVSAASEQGLQDNARTLAKYLRSNIGAGLGLADVAFTVNGKRQRHKYLAKGGPIKTIAEAADELEKTILPSFQVTNTPKGAILLFSGQTDNRVALHHSFYDQFPAFRFHIDNCDKELRSLGFSPLLPAIFQTHPLDDIATLQCGIFAVQYASARCWIDAGLKPRAVIGHSLGELTALCVSGILSLRDAIKLVATRGRLVESKWGPEKGAMLALSCSFAEFQNICLLLGRAGGTAGQRLELACHNSATSMVAVGPSATIAAAEVLLCTEPGLSHIRSQRLSTSHGFHSALVEPILEDLTPVAKSLTWNKPTIPLEICSTNAFSSVLNDPGQYIASHARDTVHFSQAVARVEDTLGQCIWIEAGMDTPVINMAKKACSNPAIHCFQSMKTPTAASSKADVVGDTIANFWGIGVFLSHWSFLQSPLADDDTGADTAAGPLMTQRCNQVWLPPYQFQKSQHWVENIDRVIEMQERCLAQNSLAAEAKSISTPQPQLVTMKVANGHRPGVSESTINTRCQRFSKLVGGHVVRSRPLCPASMYLECATMALQQLIGTGTNPSDCQSIKSSTLVFEQVQFHAPLGTEPAGEVILRLEQVDEPNVSQTWNFSVSTTKTKSKSTVCHADGTISLTKHPHSILDTYQRLVSSATRQLVSGEQEADKLMSKRAYGLFSRVVDYDSFFRGMHSVTLHEENEAVAVVRLPDGQPGRGESTAWEVCDAVMLDVCIQVAGILVNSNTDYVLRDEVAVMTGLDRVVMAPGLCLQDIGRSNHRQVYTRIDVAADQRHFAGDVFVMGEKNEMMAALCGCRFTKLPILKLERSLDLASGQPKPVKHNGFILPRVETINPGSSAFYTPCSSSTSNYASTPATEEASGTELTHEALREVISEYTGLDRADIASDAPLGDLGLDSLASVELLEQLSSRFGIQVGPDEIMDCSLASLGQRLGAISGHGSPESLKTKATSDSQISVPPKGERSMSAGPSGDDAKAAKLLSIISELSGAQAEDISASSQLGDLGIDSLSMVELQQEIGEQFSVQLDEFLPDCTVQRLMTLIGIGEDPIVGIVGYTDIVINPFVALEATNAHFDNSARKHKFLNYWKDIAPLQDKVTVACIVSAFSSLGVDLGSISHGQQIPQISGPIAQKYDRLLARLWDILQSHEIVSLAKDTGHITRGPRRIDHLSSSRLLAQLQDEHPEFRDETALIELTGPRLADFLSGKADAVSVIFGNPTASKIMANFYGQSPLLSTMTEQLVIFLMELLPHPKHSSAAIRILEVGAGTGGTTKRLAEAISSRGIAVQYTFTDISSSLVSKAKTKFKQYPWIEYATLDLEKEIPARFRNQFDLVIGTNCVHATTNREASCRRLRETLVPKSGMMVLSEVTRVIDYYDITFGLLDGWWHAEGRTAYPLQPAEWWMSTFRAAGFASVGYSSGSSPEANTQRLLLACNQHWDDTPTAAVPRTLRVGEEDGYRLETMVYKEVDGVKIHADVYFPFKPPKLPMPIALMIHGGGHMTLSRKAIRPAQRRHLLAHGFLPVSIDYRLCPEINLIDGPMADVCSAYKWAQTDLLNLVRERGLGVADGRKVVVIGWSSGGHLALSLGWTAKAAALEPPCAILSFYAPYDFLSGELDKPRLESIPGRTMPFEKIMASLPRTPVSTLSMGLDSLERNLGWVHPGDPRSEIVLSLFKDGNGLPLLLNGLPAPQKDGIDSDSDLFPSPSSEAIKAICPLARLKAGEFDVPTYVIHGTADEVAPFAAAERFVAEMKVRGVDFGFTKVVGGGHIHDLDLEPGDDAWLDQVGLGYRFLFDVVKRV